LGKTQQNFIASLLVLFFLKLIHNHEILGQSGLHQTCVRLAKTRRSNNFYIFTTCDNLVHQCSKADELVEVGRRLFHIGDALSVCVKLFQRACKKNTTKNRDCEKSLARSQQPGLNLVTLRCKACLL